MEFCPRCGRVVQPDTAYCQNCGTLLTNHNSLSSRQPYDTSSSASTSKYRGKNPWIAAGLALGFGLFGIWGVGHIYDGKIARGVALLVGGIVIGVLFWFTVFFAFLLIGIVGVAIFALFFIGGYLWQALDAYNSARDYNELYAAATRTNSY
jgi:zinc-ribbon domain